MKNEVKVILTTTSFKLPCPPHPHKSKLQFFVYFLLCLSAANYYNRAGVVREELRFVPLWPFWLTGEMEGG